MKATLRHLGLAGVLAALVCGTALAQSEAPALPNLTADQAAQVQQQLSTYRNEVEDRISRGEINPDEGRRLVDWREWQIARQVAGLVPEVTEAHPVVREYYRPYYAPAPYYAAPYYYPPYYAGPAYWGPSICAGGFGRHVGGRVCF
jgi:hypothetical protein